jgi:hypothetical protein
MTKLYSEKKDNVAMASGKGHRNMAGTILANKSKFSNSGSLRTEFLKFIYLAFFRSDSKSCMAELDSLITIDKKLNTVLTIMPISLDQNFANAIKFWNEKKYPWELTGAADTDKIRKDYQIKSLPAFYLISPQNKLVLSPALAPSHNFESLFLKIFREQKFRQKVE